MYLSVASIFCGVLLLYPFGPSRHSNVLKFERYATKMMFQSFFDVDDEDT